MRKSALKRIAEAMRDETGGQTIKSTVGVLFFLAFVVSGALINSASLPLSYNIAFGDSGNGSGSGGGGGGGSGNGESGGGIFSPRTKARIDGVRVTVYFDGRYADNAGRGTGADDYSIGSRQWSMPEYATQADNQRAIAELPFGELSHAMRVTNLGLVIPETARIFGVTVEIERSADGLNAIRDHSIRLIKNGVPVGNNKAGQVAWPSSDAINTYGNERDMWGTELSPNEAMASGFGVMIVATNNADRITPISAPLTQTGSAPMIRTPQEDILALIESVKKKRMRADIVRLQNALIRENKGPKARKLAEFGATGTYGFVTRDAAIEFEMAAKQEIKTESRPQEAVSGMLIPLYSQATQSAPLSQQAPQIPESRQDTLAQVRALKAPLIRGDKNEDVRTLQNLLIRWNIGPMARKMAEIGATGVYGGATERAVAELQRALMKNTAWPAARALIDAFAAYNYAPGSFGLATQAAEIEYLERMIAGGR